jgi:uncharacterized protein YprB with RNaseH-like and TPR domain
MFTYTEELKEQNRKNAEEFFPDREVVLFDIETTGLSRRACHIYLIGAIAKTDGKWMLTQWFLDHPFEEKELLIRFSAFLRERQKASEGKNPLCLVTFNGSTFDLPYVREKCAFYQLPDPFPDFDSIDLYRDLLPLKKLFGLPSWKQKDAENFLGIGRKDTKSGGELISVYQNYLKTRNSALLDLLLLHNHDDVIGMTDLVRALSWPLFFREHRFAVEDPAVDESAVLPARRLVFTLRPLHRLTGPSLTLSSSYAEFCADGGADTVTLCVTTRRDVLKHYYPDYRNYYYLPEEDQAIHKDVAIYVDADRRVRAKPATCYTKQAGEFLPQPADLCTPAFRGEYRDRLSWFLPTAGWLADREALHAYCCAILDDLCGVFPDRNRGHRQTASAEK